MFGWKVQDREAVRLRALVALAAVLSACDGDGLSLTDAGSSPVPPCGFTYDVDFAQPVAQALTLDPAGPEPAPPGLFRLNAPDLIMPAYADSQPVFPRGTAWDTPARCYETPQGTRWLNEAEAFSLYREIAEKTTGVVLDVTPERRSVIGLRGAYPGRLLWNGNAPNRFNDTLALLWIDAQGAPRVREFAGHTDTGAHDFGVNASSSLRANRRYPYVNGKHRGYNALEIALASYPVRDDSNHNGHWDSDRNGWLSPDGAADHDRMGTDHNIHVASVAGQLGQALVAEWSAGCQNIPGMASWTEFIRAAWTGAGQPVDYFLLDARDIDARVWSSCTPDGTHACPFVIESLPFVHSDDTSQSSVGRDTNYSCGSVALTGPEIVYLLTIDASTTIDATLTGEGMALRLLSADDPRACEAAGAPSLLAPVTPGRYVLVVDSTGTGGAYQLTVRSH